MRLTIRVTPRSARPGVGGSQDDALVVRVRQRAVEGKATEAALAALAEALDVPRRAVSLVRGATTRLKVVDVAGDEARLEGAVRVLLTSG